MPKKIKSKIPPREKSVSVSRSRSCSHQPPPPAKFETSPKIEFQVKIVKLCLFSMILLMILFTIKYAQLVFYDPLSAVSIPLSCMSESLDKRFPYFFLDKLTLLAAKRNANMFFWDSAVDISILGKKDEPINQAESKLLEAAHECGFEIVRDRKSEVGRVWSLVANNKNSTNPNNQVGFHIRLCEEKKLSSIKSDILCPFFHIDSADDDKEHKNKNNIDFFSKDHIVPLQSCVISGVETTCPANVDFLLEREFGADFLTRDLLSFKDKPHV